MQPFSIPVQITLQGGRRRQGRSAFPTSGTRRHTDHDDGDPPDVRRKRPSSAGEDRAILLGFAMMGFSVLMFFVLGVTILKPCLLSTQREESNCTIIHAHIMDDWMDCAFTCGMDCRGQGKYPCLQVFVNLTHSGQKVLLHYNEEAVQINSKCFYTPKCHQHRNDLLSGALDIKEFFDHKNGTPFSCFYSPDSQSEDVILIKKYDRTVIFHCFFWPSLTLLGGVLIVGMVRLTQYLSFLCEKHSAAFRDEVSGKVPYTAQHQRRLWRVGRSEGRSGETLRRWPNSSPGPQGPAGSALEDLIMPPRKLTG
ncbi:calcium-activated potassium channel subunit beta-3 isoform X1 [Cervus canadensis]|uniref:calcium-activated potassium channel subunit beta-3 isoform X1 n=1 Tax=Cervus canadensis TaxID=1574408 RepID=UPI001C9E2349|nr:calcium-activated potassium channel subunit beta-3 isoform X1 [Cervus canadensis]